MNPLIKWPGGKSREIKHIEKMIPEFKRYIEPFFGGGAMFFYLRPQKALINDISANLMEFYSLVKDQDKTFKQYLVAYHILFMDLIENCEAEYDSINSIYTYLKSNNSLEYETKSAIASVVAKITAKIYSADAKLIVLDYNMLESKLIKMATNKMVRTVKNELELPFNEIDLKENLITGFSSGLYMYFRDVYNDILLKRITETSKSYNIANFYFIREYCYGSMFRYNTKGEFNIPYGGMSYNRKNLKSKIDKIFSKDIRGLFENTSISCADFHAFISSTELNEHDFMFLDPPYDTDFSSYEGNDFTKLDQQRLAKALRETKAKFILVIKNTEFIYSLYKDGFNVLCFDKKYTYNVRCRNERNVEHLIISNFTV